MTTIRKPIFVIPLDLGTMVSGNVLYGYPVTHLNRHKAIGLTWRSDGAGNLWVRGKFSSAREIDFCAIVAGNALPDTQYRLRLGATQAQVDGESAPYDSEAIDFIDPAITRDDGIYHSHLELDDAETATWWRIDISGHTGDFQASSIVMGKKLEPSRFYDLDFQYGVNDLGGMEITRFGVLDEEPGVILRTVEFTMAWQTEAELEASFRPMIETLGKRGILYCCFDPEPTTYRQARTYMGVFAKTPFARGVKKPRTFTMDFEIQSFI